MSKKKMSVICMLILILFQAFPILADTRSDFLEALVRGINTRQSYSDQMADKEAAMSEEEQVEYYGKLAQLELTEIEPFYTTEFEDEDFGNLVRAYIEGVKLQKEAARYGQTNPDLFELSWKTGSKMCAISMVEFCDTYGLEIEQEAEESFKDTAAADIQMPDTNGREEAEEDNVPEVPAAEETLTEEAVEGPEEVAEESEEAAEEPEETISETIENLEEDSKESADDSEEAIETADDTSEEEPENSFNMAFGTSLYPDGVSVALNGASYNEAAPDWTEYTQLIENIRNEINPEKRAVMMHHAEDILMASAAVVPIYYYNDVYLQKMDVYDIYADPGNYKYFQLAFSPRDVLKVCLGGEPDTLDPGMMTDRIGGTLDVNLFSGLYTYGADGRLQPDLADPENPYEVSDDGLIYTFHLREDLRWSNGTFLTAKDFEYAWKRCADPATASFNDFLFDVFALDKDGSIKVEATDDHTLVAALKTPCQYFLELCALPAYFPISREYVEAWNGQDKDPGAWCTEAGFVTNGAYTVKFWIHEDSMVLEKNPNYHRADEVSIEEIDFIVSDNADAAYAAYNSDDLDYVNILPTGAIEGTKDNDDFHSIDSLGTFFAAFNVNSPLFDGKTVDQAITMRKAFSLVIDRQFILDWTAGKEKKVATSFIPPGMRDGNGSDFKENTALYTFPYKESIGYYPIQENGVEDEALEEARMLLEYAGYVFNDDGVLSDKTPIRFTYLTDDGTSNMAIAESIQQDFSYLGINMDIETLDLNAFLNERMKGNYDLVRAGWTADYNDPVNMLELFTPESYKNYCWLGVQPE